MVPATTDEVDALGARRGPAMPASDRGVVTQLEDGDLASLQERPRLSPALNPACCVGTLTAMASRPDTDAGVGVGVTAPIRTAGAWSS